MIPEVPDAEPEAAVIVAVPSATPETSPDPSTAATDASFDDQVNCAPPIPCPFASNASAASRIVSPGAIVAAAGDTATESTVWITVTTASPDASPDVAVIAASPTPAAVTSPAESTAATVVSALVQVTWTSSITRPRWSRASAVSCTVCPNAVSDTVSGVTATVVGIRATTPRAARPVMSAAVAVTFAWPAPTPVTRPVSSTTATSVSLDAHENSASATGWPFASAAAALRRSVSPTNSVSAAGKTVTALTFWTTVTAAVPDADPAAAVIVAVPLAAAVTRPVELTVATAGAPLVQVTVAPVIACPYWSRTSAASCTAAPTAVSSAVAGLTVTIVGRGGSTGGEGGSVAPSPQPAAHTRPASATTTSNEMRQRLMADLSRAVKTGCGPQAPQRSVRPGQAARRSRGRTPCPYRDPEGPTGSPIVPS